MKYQAFFSRLSDFSLHSCTARPVASGLAWIVLVAICLIPASGFSVECEIPQPLCEGAVIDPSCSDYAEDFESLRTDALDAEQGFNSALEEVEKECSSLTSDPCEGPHTYQNPHLVFECWILNVECEEAKLQASIAKDEAFYSCLAANQAYLKLLACQGPSDYDPEIDRPGKEPALTCLETQEDEAQTGSSGPLIGPGGLPGSPAL